MSTKQHEDAMKIKGWAGCKQKVKKIVTFINHRISSSNRNVDPVYGSPSSAGYGPNGFVGRIIFNAAMKCKKRGSNGNSSDGDGSSHGTESKSKGGKDKNGGKKKGLFGSGAKSGTNKG